MTRASLKQPPSMGERPRDGGASPHHHPTLPVGPGDSPVPQASWNPSPCPPPPLQGLDSSHLETSAAWTVSPGGPFKPAAALLPTLPPDTHTLPAWSPRTSAHLSPLTDDGYHARGRVRGGACSLGPSISLGPLPSQALPPEGSRAPRQAADLGHRMSDAPAPEEGPARPTVGGRGRERGPWLPILSLLHKQMGCCRARHPNFLPCTLADGPVGQLCCLPGSRESCRGGSEAWPGPGGYGDVDPAEAGPPLGTTSPGAAGWEVWVSLCPPHTRILTAQRCPRMDPPVPQSARDPSRTVPVSPHFTDKMSTEPLGSWAPALGSHGSGFHTTNSDFISKTCENISAAASAAKTAQTWRDHVSREQPCARGQAPLSDPGCPAPNPKAQRELPTARPG